MALANNGTAHLLWRIMVLEKIGIGEKWYWRIMVLEKSGIEELWYWRKVVFEYNGTAITSI